MSKQIISEEFKRMQKLAGLITESQLNESLTDLSDAAVKLLMDKSKYMLKPGTSTGAYVVYDLSLPKGKSSFGDDDSTQKVGVLWTKDSTYKSNKFESDDNDTIKKLMALKESQLNEDNLEVKRIAKDLYSFLKKNGVEVKLSAHGDKSYKKIGQIDMGMSMGKTMDNAGIISYYDDPNTKQTIIQIQLYGGPTSKDLVVGVEQKLLAAYPGLEQFDRQEIPGKTNFNLNFRVKEKTTAKGGLVGNTKTNPKPAAQPQAESLDIDSIVNEALAKFRKK